MNAKQSILAGLSTALGETAVTEGSPGFSVDGIVPGAVVRPKDYAGVATTLSFANENGLTVIPLGGRQHAHIGNLPTRYDVALNLAALNAVVEFEPADLTITVQAGLTLGELRQTTAGSGLIIPFDPSAPDDATVGGMIAAGIFGAAAASLGTPRDFTIGLRVVMADGRMTRAGGKVVKNVAGYDLCKLYTGSVGTLGVIVEASLKALPSPPAEQRLNFAMDSAEQACSHVRSAFRAGLSIRSASMHRIPGGWSVHVVLAGTRAGVDRSYREMATDTVASDDVSDPPQYPLEMMVTVLPSRLAGLLEELAAQLREAAIEAWPASGVCVIRTHDIEHSITTAMSLATMHQGTFTVPRCPFEIKTNRDVFGDEPSAAALIRQIKHEFDPKGTLSPGRGPGRI
ncbi:MAG: FAD-binding oxidoreductase [Dehalococcoidia bacterium]